MPQLSKGMHSENSEIISLTYKQAVSMGVGRIIFRWEETSGIFQGWSMVFFKVGPTVVKFHFITSKLREKHFFYWRINRKISYFKRKYHISNLRGRLAVLPPFRRPWLWGTFVQYSTAVNVLCTMSAAMLYGLCFIVFTPKHNQILKIQQPHRWR